jgi:putative protease
VELESFGHGALCFCYSGVCMMSSLRGGRSANRGLCAQPCRLPYDLVDGDGNVISAPGAGRPLCPKDFRTLDDLPRLTAAGLGSLKVEGRMKAPDYVYSVISAYRAQLDDLAAGREVTEADETARSRTLARAFNRDFTNSYLDGRSDNDMMSYDRSNNRGELVGTVVATRDLGSAKVRRGGGSGGRDRFRTVTMAEVDVRLDAPVGAGDLLEVRPQDDPSQFLTTRAEADAAAGDVICCKTARPMPVGCPVRVIRSERAMDEAARAASGEKRRRLPVRVAVTARVGRPFAVTLTCAAPLPAGVASATAEGFVVEPARTRAVTREDLVEHVGRMGTSPFEPVAFDVDLDEGAGMGFSAVHKVRAQACDLLEQAILAPTSDAARKEGLADVPDANALAAELRRARGRVRKALAEEAPGIAAGAPVARPAGEVCALVPTPAVARAAVAAGATRLYATPDALAQARGRGAAWPMEPVPWLDEVCREVDHDRLDPLVRAGCPCGVGNVSELVLSRERGALAEVRPCIPVHNPSCLLALEEAGARGVWLSPELTLGEACELAGASDVPVGLVVSGRTRAMTSEHCVLQVANRCIHDCANCRLRQERCALRTRDGSLMPVRTDLEGRSHIYAAHPLDATPQMGELFSAGVTRFMADCTLLGEAEAGAQVARVAAALAAVRAGRKPTPRVKGATSGHLFAGIE